MKLFCLPYAGGSEIIYYEWKKYIHPVIQLHPIELKGRGKRYDEAFYNNLNEAIEDIYENIKNNINDEYAIFGHSMGAILAYELYYKIYNIGLKLPQHMFFSGSKPPNVVTKFRDRHNLSDIDLIEKLSDLGGTPQELIENHEFMKEYLPIYRNDLKILEMYKYEEKKTKINSNVSVMNGMQDNINNKDLLEWEKLVSSTKLRTYNFDGNHFFINTNTTKVVKFINDILVLIL